MQSNRAPRCDWLSREMLCGTVRRRLFVNGAETAYFIDTPTAERHKQARGRRVEHTLYGSGQGAKTFGLSASAALVDAGAKVELLMHRAEQLATA